MIKRHYFMCVHLYWNDGSAGHSFMYKTATVKSIFPEPQKAFGNMLDDIKANMRSDKGDAFCVTAFNRI